jgi:hypothetical protein
VPLSWNEIKSRALAFSRTWEGETSERAEAQSFCSDFFGVFGIERRRVAIFGKQVKLVRAGEYLKRGRIDAFWKGMLLIEHKSAPRPTAPTWARNRRHYDHRTCTNRFDCGHSYGRPGGKTGWRMALRPAFRQILLRIVCGRMLPIAPSVGCGSISLIVETALRDL